MRGALLQRPPNGVADGRFLAPQPGVPEAKHFDAARFQPRIASRVLGLLFGRAVLNAVRLDIQPGFLAKVVHDVRSERMLSAEFVFGETPVAQPMPHELFGPPVAVLHRACDARKARGRHEGSAVEFIGRSQAHWSFERYLPPHPGPLLRGEGESRAAAWRIERAGSCERLDVESRSERRQSIDVGPMKDAGGLFPLPAAP